jgi:hypothetical protein
VEQSQNDTNRHTLQKDLEEAREDRARLLLEENAECERALIQLMGRQEDANVITFEGAEMAHFLKMKPQLLKAFIKACILDESRLLNLKKCPRTSTRRPS